MYVSYASTICIYTSSTPSFSNSNAQREIFNSSYSKSRPELALGPLPQPCQTSYDSPLMSACPPSPREQPYFSKKRVASHQFLPQYYPLLFVKPFLEKKRPSKQICPVDDSLSERYTPVYPGPAGIACMYVIRIYTRPGPDSLFLPFPSLLEKQKKK